MSGDWHPVCKVEDILLSGSQTIIAGERTIAMFRLSDGRIMAVDNRCPHKGGPLAEGVLTGNEIICPLHNWHISLETGEVIGSESGCVRTYPVRIEDGDQVLIQL